MRLYFRLVRAAWLLSVWTLLAVGVGGCAGCQGTVMGGPNMTNQPGSPGLPGTPGKTDGPGTNLTPTYEVGPGKSYADLQALVAAVKLKAGDIVFVHARGSAYPGNITIEDSGSADKRIHFVGIRSGGQRPVISGGSNGIKFDLANHIIFEGFEVTAAADRCIFHAGHNLTLRDVVVHDCPKHGVLGADEGSGTIIMEHVEVYRCGSGDRYHPVYIATDEDAHPGSVFRMQNCYLHDQNGGNNVKSRAERNEIYYNWIEGGFYRELELIAPDTDDTPTREDSDVVGNVLMKTQGTFVSRVGTDAGSGSTYGRYRFAYNTIILQPSSTTIMEVYGSIDSLEMHNNVFYRLGGGGVRLYRDDNASGAYVHAGMNNWIPADSTSVPAAWQGTKVGSDPGFVNASSRDFRIASASILKGGAHASAPSPSGHAFPTPLPLPLYLPPSHALATPGSAVSRSSSTPYDIGAYDTAH